MQAAVQIKSVREYLAKPEETVALLTPKVKGERLVLTLDEANQGITKATALLTPPLEYVRAQVGLVRLFPPTLSAGTLRALFTRSGGEVIQWDF